MYRNETPAIFAGAVAAAFLLLIVTFCVYDWTVWIRNRRLIQNAAKSSEIVTSMFPGALRDKIMEQRSGTAINGSKEMNDRQYAASQFKALMSGDDLNEIESSVPLAELYLNTTVFFADIVGFTAWLSGKQRVAYTRRCCFTLECTIHPLCNFFSVREPAQVFQLLESVYRVFDMIARKQRVFKVETVGDCYVSVTGFPQEQADHAVRMCRFASNCLDSFESLVRRLEVRLGPDTGALGIRMGIHSGQVTAGVLRGDRARFQLFGDTVNVTARMEETSEKGRIQLSNVTAKLLEEAGKSQWLKQREDIVVAKGKGAVNTFWLECESSQSIAVKVKNTKYSQTDIDSTAPDLALDKAYERLVDWNAETLLSLTKKVVARRKNSRKAIQQPKECARVQTVSHEKTFLDEVQEIITLPKFSAQVAETDASEVEVDPQVASQLKNYVIAVASTYRNNPFHNFEHASHVVMSVMKLMSRIVAPSEAELDSKSTTCASTLHDHTYGITSDPLTHFACVFSALIHDCDHRGVPNSRLAEEDPVLAKRYRDRSVAEQNSLDVAWSLLMDNEFSALRETLFASDDELTRFRQLVVNAVMATDIMDKGLKELRNGRWDKAFSPQTGSDDDSADDKVNRKATIVIEHLIQASDVSHTMQHWHIYRKWNERLFQEMYEAFRAGRSEKNPADFWVKGELGFFDFYIIPLAKKLKDCGVFGVSSDEYLNYAVANRQEWEARGEEIVAQMMENYETEEQKHRQLLI